MFSRIDSELLKKYFYFLVYLLAGTFFFERIPSLETALGPVRLYNILIPLIIFSFLYLNKIKVFNYVDYNIPKSSILLFIFLLSGIFSFQNIVNINRFLAAFLSILFCISSCLILSTIKLNPNKLIKIFVYLFIGQFIFSVHQFVGDKFLKLPETLTGLKPLFQSNVFGIPRVHNTYNEPAYYANALFLGIFLFLFLSTSRINIFGAKIKYFRVIYVFLFLVSLTIFILTLAKSAWLILPIPLILALLYIFISITNKQIKLIFICLIVSFFGFGIISTRFAPNIVSNISNQFIETIEGNSATSIERTAYSNAAMQIIPNYILTGIGPGQFGTYASNNIVNNLFPLDQAEPYPYLINKPTFNYRSVVDTEKNIVFNVYIEVLLEYGIVSFFFFLFFIFYVIIETLKKLYITNSTLNDINVLRLSLSFYIICSLGQFVFISPVYINPFFVALGLLISLNQNYEKSFNQ
jgi:O-antigen ligase